MLCALLFGIRRYSSHFLLSKSPRSRSGLFFSTFASTMAVSHPKDEAYLKAVIEKRIKFFESIKSQQLSHLQSLDHDPIK